MPLPVNQDQISQICNLCDAFKIKNVVFAKHLHTDVNRFNVAPIIPVAFPRNPLRNSIVSKKKSDYQISPVQSLTPRAHHKIIPGLWELNINSPDLDSGCLNAIHMLNIDSISNIFPEIDYYLHKPQATTSRLIIIKSVICAVRYGCNFPLFLYSQFLRARDESMKCFKVKDD